jgi:hypothetical protein
MLQNWQEKEEQPLKKKVKQVLNHLGVALDWETRPYSSMDGLRRFRARSLTESLLGMSMTRQCK